MAILKVEAGSVYHGQSGMQWMGQLYPDLSILLEKWTNRHNILHAQHAGIKEINRQGASPIILGCRKKERKKAR